ncbi:MAG: hypothetical protein HRU12_06755, partial [Phaeodactylibacter sp.]|nr:hypothetical protein [Phaeodactylibacter sp.]
ESNSEVLADAFSQQAILYGLQQVWPLSVQAARASLNIKKDAKVYLQLGQSLLALGENSKEAKEALEKAQRLGIPTIQIEAGLGLAQWELAHGKRYAVLAQLDKVAPLIYDRFESRGLPSSSEPASITDHYARSTARLELLKAKALILEGETSASNAFQSVCNGLEVLKGNEKNNAKLQESLFGLGFHTLSLQPDAPSLFKSFIETYQSSYPDRLPVMATENLNGAPEMPSIYYLEADSAFYVAYTTTDTLVLSELEASATRKALTQLNSTPLAAEIPAGIYPHFFGAFQNALSEKETTMLILPNSWPMHTFLEMPTGVASVRGLWPFKRKAKTVSEKFDLVYAEKS